MRGIAEFNWGKRILLVLGIIILLRILGWRNDCFAKPHVFGCMIQFLLPTLIFLFVLGFSTWIYWRSLLHKTTLTPPHPLLLLTLFLSTSLIYLHGCHQFSQQQQFMDNLYFTFFRGDNVSWHGEKLYKIQWKHLERNQSEVMGRLQPSEMERVMDGVEAVRKGLRKYTKVMDGRVGYWRKENQTATGPALSLIFKQSYLQQQPYNLYHLGIYNLTTQLLSDLQSTAEAGQIFDLKLLQSYHIYRKKQQGKFNGWLENRYMFANMELVLWRDGGWIVYSMMLIAMLVLFLTGRCEGVKGVLGWIRTVWVMNSIGFLIVVFAFGFYLPFIAGSGLSEFIEYESLPIHKLNTQSKPFFQLVALDRAPMACFSNSSMNYEQRQLEQVISIMKLDSLKHNFQRMLENINSLGERNNEKWNMFRMVEEFNEENKCPKVRFVVDQRFYQEGGKKQQRIITNLTKLDKSCVESVQSLSNFVNQTLSQLSKAKKYLQMNINQIQHIQQTILRARYLPFVRSHVNCQNWTTYHKKGLQNQSSLQNFVGTFSLLSLILLFITFSVFTNHSPARQPQPYTSIDQDQ